MRRWSPSAWKSRPSPALARNLTSTLPVSRPDLVLQMPRELYQPELVELPISLRQPQDLLPRPAYSPCRPLGALESSALGTFLLLRGQVICCPCQQT